MIHSPTSGPIGLQPHGNVAKMINRTGGTAAIGDVVCLSFDSPVAFTLTPSTDSDLRLSPFASVKKADNAGGTLTSQGYIGVVVGLGAFAGANTTEIDVQFGGIVSVVKCNAVTNNIVLGTTLYLSDTEGNLSNAAGSTTDTAVGVYLGSTITAGNSGTGAVLIKSDVFGL